MQKVEMDELVMAHANALETRVAELSNLLSHVLALQEAERRAITQTLQEDIGQALAAFALKLRVLEQHCDSDLCAELISDMRQLTAGTLRELDHLQRHLYPPALDSQGVVAAIEVHVQEYSHLTQTQVELDAEVPRRRLPAAHELALFRMFQEALEQIRLLDCASDIHIRLRFIKEFAYLVIEANGAGDITGWRTTLIKERAEGLGGRCAIAALPDGSRFEIALPVQGKEPV